MPFIKNDKSATSPYKRLLDLIPEGEQDAVSMRTLSRCLGITEREVRALVKSARCAGNIIGGTPSGYYIPENEEELRSYYRFAYSRVRGSCVSLAPVRKLLKEAGDDDTDILS